METVESEAWTQERLKSYAFMVFSAVFYGICSGSMNFINKLLLNTWSFRQPGVILVAQLAFLVIALKLLDFFQKIELVKYTFSTAKSCLLLSSLYAANTFLALFALGGMNIPMYVAMRRCVPLPSLLLGRLLLKRTQNNFTIISVCFITVGAVVAGIGDISFDMLSYVMGATSAVLMASYLVTLQYSGTMKNFKSTDLLYINSINCIPIIALMSLGSLPELLSYPHLNDIHFFLSFLLVVLSGCLLNYSMFLCTVVNSALTTTCVGVMKSGIVTVLGMFLFGGAEPTTLFVLGLSLSFGGGVMFTYSKYSILRT